MGTISNLKKHKGLLILGICLVFLILILCIFMVINTSKGDLHLKHRKVHVEFGEEISTNPKDYLDLSKMNANEQVEYLKNVKVVKNSKKVEGKQYEAIGTYVIEISDTHDKIEVKVIVEDTTSPKFDKISKIETFEGIAPDYTKYIKARDIDEKVSISVNDKDVKLNEVGEYKIKVTAEDSSKNKSTKEIAVIVKEKPENSDVSYTVDENGNVIANAIPRNDNNSDNNVGSSDADENPRYDADNNLYEEPDHAGTVYPSEDKNNTEEPSEESDSQNSNPIIKELGNTGWQGNWDELVERANAEAQNPNSPWFNCTYIGWPIDKNETIWTIDFQK